jgi:hypothetical protein
MSSAPIGPPILPAQFVPVVDGVPVDEDPDEPELDEELVVAAGVVAAGDADGSAAATSSGIRNDAPAAPRNSAPAAIPAAIRLST